MHASPRNGTHGSNRPRVSIIIINWNSAPLLERCLQSLRHDPDAGSRQVIVVDNASDEDPSPMIESVYADAEVVRCEMNLGFSGGNNFGVGRASGEYLLFLNADTEVEPGVVEALTEFLDGHADAAAVGPRLVGADGRMQNSAGVFPGAMQYVASALRLSPKPGGPTRAVDYVAGAALMVRREQFIAAGRWPEAYFFYGEDAELCLRLRYTTAPLTYYLADVTISHLEGGSVASIPKWKALAANRGALLFVARNRTPGALAAMRLAVAGSNAARLVLYLAALPAACLVGKARTVADRIHTYASVVRLAFSRAAALDDAPPPVNADEDDQDD